MDTVQVIGEWTIHGERAHFSIIFPPDEPFTVGQVGDESEMRFRLELFNSVDGSYRFIAIAGWLRFVCSNGLIVGTALIHLRQQHRQQLEIEELGKLVAAAISSAHVDKERFERWIATPLDRNAMVAWGNKELREQWGTKAAVRVLRIASEGWDVEPVGDVKRRLPSQITTKRVARVPGVDAPISNLFGLCQVLSWVAGQRLETGENLAWRSQVNDLMAAIIV